LFPTKKTKNLLRTERHWKVQKSVSVTT